MSDDTIKTQRIPFMKYIHAQQSPELLAQRLYTGPDGRLWVLVVWR